MTEVFGRSPMYWYRLERSLGRFSLVGTTVQAAERLPRHLAADEKHTTLVDGKSRKVYLAATAGGGCCLGMALAESADADELARAYGVFRGEAHPLDPEYRPETVHTDGGPATQAAERAFQAVPVHRRAAEDLGQRPERDGELAEKRGACTSSVWPERYGIKKEGRTR